jgi:hypothetical protein
MEEPAGMLAGMLRYAARMLPPGRRPWAEAVLVEAGQVPPGWPRLRWLAVTGDNRVPRRRYGHRPGYGPGHKPGRLRGGADERSLCRHPVPRRGRQLFLFAALAGLMAAWLLPGTGDPENVRVARGLQGLLAGSVAGGVCGLLLTNFYVIAVVMMIIGPVVGALGGAVGGLVAAGHPLRPRPARSWAAGVFVRF